MNQEPIIVGLCGPMRCGKTTAAEYLQTGYAFKRRRFAGPLKDMLRSLGLTDEEVDGSLKEEPCALLGGKTPRHAMQTLGTEWGRDLIDSGLWTRAWKKSLPQGFDVVVDDVRFPNEVALIKELGGVVVRIERKGTGIVAGHISEAHALPADAVIKNDGSIEELHDQFDWLLNVWFNEKVA